MKTPIEMMLDGLTWVPIERDELAHNSDDGLPFATHEGVLDIMGQKFRCYRLSSGQAVIHADDMEQFFCGLFEGLQK